MKTCRLISSRLACERLPVSDSLGVTSPHGKYGESAFCVLTEAQTAIGAPTAGLPAFIVTDSMEVVGFEPTSKGAPSGLYPLSIPNHPRKVGKHYVGMF